MLVPLGKFPALGAIGVSPPVFTAVDYPSDTPCLRRGSSLGKNQCQIRSNIWVSPLSLTCSCPHISLGKYDNKYLETEKVEKIILNNIVCSQNITKGENYE